MMQVQMLGLGALVFVLATGIERGARVAFPAAIPPEKGGLCGPSSRAVLPGAAWRERKEE